MYPSAWNTPFSLLAMLFWLAVWAAGDRRLTFNPYLGPLLRWVDAILSPLQRALRVVPARALAVAMLLAVLGVQAAVVVAGYDAPAVLGLYQMRPGSGSLPGALRFCVLSFAVFLFQVWSVSILYVHTHGRALQGPAAEALYQASRPFADLRADLRPLGLALYGMLLAYIIECSGQGHALDTAALAGAAAVVKTLLRTFVVAFSAWAGVLQVLSNVLFLLIIGSWVAMFSGAHGLLLLCQDWLDFLLGPLRRFPLRIGSLDLTPLIMMFALGFVHRLIMVVLANSFVRLM